MWAKIVDTAESYANLVSWFGGFVVGMTILALVVEAAGRKVAGWLL